MASLARVDILVTQLDNTLLEIHSMLQKFLRKASSFIQCISTEMLMWHSSKNEFFTCTTGKCISQTFSLTKIGLLHFNHNIFHSPLSCKYFLRCVKKSLFSFKLYFYSTERDRKLKFPTGNPSHFSYTSAENFMNFR